MSNRLSKKIRQEVYDKFEGKCAYTGVLLPNDWQVDHVIPKFLMEECYGATVTADVINNIDNLLPALAIVNHYKRGLDLEGFREYMNNFHNRLAKLPKRTSVERTKNRIVYMNKVAEVFGIDNNNPFCGVFWFEKPQPYKGFVPLYSALHEGLFLRSYICEEFQLSVQESICGTMWCAVPNTNDSEVLNKFHLLFPDGVAHKDYRTVINIIKTRVCQNL